MEQQTIQEPAARQDRVTAKSEAETGRESRSLARYWQIFAAFTVTAILIAAIRWSLAHPYGIHWDESGYIDDAFIDVQRLRHWMLLKAAGRILVTSSARPPAYRLLADPVLALFGASTTLARIVSLACYGLSSWYVYRAAKQIGGRIAGAFAALIFCLSPEVIAASAFFGTDAALYLATAAMLFQLLKTLSGERESTRDWIVLGLAIGLGFLSKTSFLLIGPPALVCWFVVSRRKRTVDRGIAFPLKAGALALLVAGPWWLLHAKDAAAYAQYARAFVRNSLGPPSLATWMKWMDTVIQALLGHGTSLLIALVAITCLAAMVRGKGVKLQGAQRPALWVCACAGVPIVLAQLAGTNHLLRHITPSVIPFAIAVGILAEKTLWSRKPAGMAFASLLLAAQLGMIVYPVVFPNTAPVDIGFVNGALPWRSLARFDQWNWKPLWEISNACNLESPRISYLGNGREFDPPAIQYPWLMAAMPMRLSKIAYPDVTWLWRYEDGTFDWQKVMGSAAGSDLVVTAPYYRGEAVIKEDEDNRHNSEFAQRLSQDSRFQGPILFQVGRFSPVEIAVFAKRGLNCQAPPTGSPKQ